MVTNLSWDDYADAAPEVKNNALNNMELVDNQQKNNAALILGGATGLEALELGAARIRVDDKKIINCYAYSSLAQRLQNLCGHCGLRAGATEHNHRHIGPGRLAPESGHDFVD